MKIKQIGNLDDLIRPIFSEVWPELSKFHGFGAEASQRHGPAHQRRHALLGAETRLALNLP
jgi:hypothetical protein